MEPRRDDDALVGLLDTLVERGVVVDADLVIAVGDVPLVGVRLRAALAGMSTMTEHGYFEGWDDAWRAEATETESSVTPTVGKSPDQGPPEEL
jgi:hypothetical protein